MVSATMQHEAIAGAPPIAGHPIAGAEIIF